MTILQVDSIRKKYGTNLAVDDLSFTITEGEIVGFLGPNGAGKSTTMKMICGYLSADRGTIRIRGNDVLEKRLEAQRLVGYLPESNPLYPELRVEEFLKYCARIRSLGSAQRTRAIDRVLDRCGLQERRRQNISELSKGYKQRVGLAQALLHDPPLLILDEPTTGLDPNQIGEIRKLIREIGQKKTVILSTHILSEVQATCDRVLIIHQGRCAADASVEDVIRQNQGGTLLRISFAADKVQMPLNLLHQKLTELPDIKDIRHLPSSNEEMEFEALCTADIRMSLFRFAVEEGLALVQLSRAQSALEDVFRKLTV